MIRSSTRGPTPSQAVKSATANAKLAKEGLQRAAAVEKRARAKKAKAFAKRKKLRANLKALESAISKMSDQASTRVMLAKIKEARALATAASEKAQIEATA